ncbi:hypothetical protein JTE90_011872 [Oedothorax gibbosus]|uniref:Uncharacterized protein n=1 Tax=Oedothorax gibbosus TaxID=931172 RepID=A0AAV6V5M2_9ARAC|nr:hypothetical protein JTE90_011872 [Oedothorax gibbosus]
MTRYSRGPTSLAPIKCVMAPWGAGVEPGLWRVSTPSANQLNLLGMLAESEREFVGKPEENGFSATDCRLTPSLLTTPQRGANPNAARSGCGKVSLPCFGVKAKDLYGVCGPEVYYARYWTMLLPSPSLPHFYEIDPEGRISEIVIPGRNYEDTPSLGTTTIVEASCETTL